MSLFAISDIHGCAKTFAAMLDQIQLSTGDELYLLGDFIDRGPSSKQLIDHIWSLQKQGYQIHCLKGNHDQMMLDAREDSKAYEDWLLSGGRETMDSFGAKHISEVSPAYFDFFAQMPHCLEANEYIMVHAGFSFDMPDPFDERHSMLWARNWYERINYPWLGDRIILHGHTPILKKKAERMLERIMLDQYLDIDTGCVFHGRAPGFGFLSCFDLEQRVFHFQENVD